MIFQDPYNSDRPSSINLRHRRRAALRSTTAHEREKEERVITAIRRRRGWRRRRSTCTATRTALERAASVSAIAGAPC